MKFLLLALRNWASRREGWSDDARQLIRRGLNAAQCHCLRTRAAEPRRLKPDGEPEIINKEEGKPRQGWPRAENRTTRQVVWRWRRSLNPRRELMGGGFWRLMSCPQIAWRGVPAA